MLRKLGITERSYHRWREAHDRLRVDQAKPLKEFEKGNARLEEPVPHLSSAGTGHVG